MFYILFNIPLVLGVTINRLKTYTLKAGCVYSLNIDLLLFLGLIPVIQVCY